ncbi:MAG: hypothetical protein KH020_15685, partial [Clostridiales bacterium]|nr:hypothetical protein [Clostridiales bacterium]
MNKKNLSVIMAAAMISTSVAPVFAAETTQVKKETITKKEATELVSKVRDLMSQKYTGGSQVGQPIYEIKVGETLSKLKIITNIDELIGIFEQPIKTLENSYWVTGMAKQSSEDGVKVLLIGQNGNVSISFGDFFIHMQTLIRQLKFGEVISEVNAANKRYGKPKKAIYSTIISNAIPYKIKKIRHRKEDTIENKFEDSVIKLDLIKKYNVEERFDKKGYNSVITKVGTLKETRKSILDEATLAHIGIMETKDSLAYGIIKRDPSKDKRIMEFCLSIPSEAYVHEGEERYLIRSSMVGILPEEIRTNWRNRGIQSADWVE